MTVQNSTISGNLTRWGGGIYVVKDTDAATTVENSTVSGNIATSSGGGIYTYRPVTIKNSIVAGQTAGADCKVATGGSFSSQGYNIESATSCGFTNGVNGNDQLSVSGHSLNLGALANNGGPTQTRALGASSVAVDHIPIGTNGCAATNKDQRGADRANGAGKGGSACDVGAYEYDSATPTAVGLRALDAASAPSVGAWGAAGGIAAAFTSALALFRRRRR